ncbi:MAG: uroporphyrinogen-III C-methyltransferase [Candidatus Omnitrophota bacterium]
MKKIKGKVFLVGVGPGDERLLTIWALDCIKEADVIVYDHLISEAILRFRKPKTKLIYVGKTLGKHTFKQEAVNRILEEQAKKSKNVVRLKGGDPFLFGRGAEEALFLKSKGIEFEVIPGITSGIAVPELSGIPLTHRGVASLVTFVTGHEDPTKKNKDVDWVKLAKLRGTLVIFMGMNNLSKIIRQLITNGKGEKTPVSIIQWGTFQTQKSVTGTLRNIENKVKKEKIQHPAIIIIGEVVRLHNKLAKIKRTYLLKEKILITNPSDSADNFSKKLQNQGAQVLSFPLIEMVKNKNTSNKTIVNKIKHCDWLVFTSKTAVNICFDALKSQGKDSRIFRNCKIAVIGDQTKRLLQAYSIKADLVPRRFCMEGLIDKFKKINIKGKQIFIPHSKQARSLLIVELNKQGAIIDEVFIYMVKKPKNAKRTTLKKVITGQKPTLITFTSSSCVHEFMKLLKNEIKLLKQQKFAVIGPVTNQTLNDYGFKAKIIAQKFTEDGLVKAILQANL